MYFPSEESLDVLVELFDIESLRNAELPDLNNLLNNIDDDRQPLRDDIVQDGNVQDGGAQQPLVEISRKLDKSCVSWSV